MVTLTKQQLFAFWLEIKKIIHTTHGFNCVVSDKLLNNSFNDVIYRLLLFSFLLLSSSVSTSTQTTLC